MAQPNNPYGKIPDVNVTDPTATTTKPPCNPTYVGVTMKAGDKFILPSGATIVSSTAGASALSSDCADLSKIETPVCYMIAISVGDDQNKRVEAWTRDRTDLVGIEVAGKFYGFGFAPQQHIDDNGPNMWPIREFISGHPVLRNIMLCMTDNKAYENQPTGGTGTLCFKTIPSIGDTIKIHVTTGHEWPSVGGVLALFPARKTSDFTIANGMCGCSC